MLIITNMKTFKQERIEDENIGGQVLYFHLRDVGQSSVDDNYDEGLRIVINNTNKFDKDLFDFLVDHLGLTRTAVG